MTVCLLEPSLDTCLSIDASTGKLELKTDGLECLQNLHPDSTEPIVFFIQVFVYLVFYFFVSGLK